MMRLAILSVATFTLTAPMALAEGDWIVGIIVDGDQSPYVEGMDSVDVLPYIAFETERFHIGIDGISYEAFDNGSLSIDARLDPRFAPDLPNTTLFDGLDRDDAIDAGLSANYSFGQTYAAVRVKGDVTGVYDGFAGELAIGYETVLGPLLIDASAGVQLRDANLNNYLYGVSTEEAADGRPAFKLSNTANAFAEVTVLMPVADDMFVLGEIWYADLGEAADSPLVADDSRLGITLGLGYQF